jgi:ABC-type Fe3+ transport system substrate-binding protein
MLLVDFILSKAGQQILVGAEYYPADPTVALAPQLASVVPKIAGVAENFVAPETLLKYTDSSEAIYQKLFR